MGERLKELNGLRNVIVEEKREFVFETLNEFVEKVENVIKRIFG